MFAIMYESQDDGKVFKIYKTLDEARERARNIACMGYEVTIFDYDAEAEEYVEFCKI